MAAGSFIFYMSAIERIFAQNLDLRSKTLMVTLTSAGAYTPNAKSHSAYSTNVEPHISTAASFAPKKITSSSVFIASGSYVTWDMEDATISAGATIKSKYAVVYCEADPQWLVGYFDTETTQTTGVEVTQLVVQWNTLGVAQINNPAA